MPNVAAFSSFADAFVFTMYKARWLILQNAVTHFDLFVPKRERHYPTPTHPHPRFIPPTPSIACPNAQPSDATRMLCLLMCLFTAILGGFVVCLARLRMLERTFDELNRIITLVQYYMNTPRVLGDVWFMLGDLGLLKDLVPIFSCENPMALFLETIYTKPTRNLLVPSTYIHRSSTIMYTNIATKLRLPRLSGGGILVPLVQRSAAPCVVSPLGRAQLFLADATPSSYVVARSTPLLIEYQYPALEEDVLYFVEDNDDVVFELDMTHVKSYRTILDQVVRQVECDSANLDEVRSTLNTYGEPVLLLDLTLRIPTHAVKLTVATLPAHEGMGHGIFRLPFGKKVAFEVVSHKVDMCAQSQPEIPTPSAEDDSARFEWVEEGAWGVVIEDDEDFLDLDADTEDSEDKTDVLATPSVQHTPSTHSEPSAFGLLVEDSPVISTGRLPAVDDAKDDKLGNNPGPSSSTPSSPTPSSSKVNQDLSSEAPTGTGDAAGSASQQERPIIDDRELDEDVTPPSWSDTPVNDND